LRDGDLQLGRREPTALKNAGWFRFKDCFCGEMEQKRMADFIHIRGLEVWCIIGINEDERLKEQKIIVNVRLAVDTRRASETDDIADTVDYKSLKNELMDYTLNSSFGLLEALAERLANICLRYKGVSGVRLSIDKPGALRHAESVAVEIERGSLP
jgi:FolB domain-containing protein